MGNIVDGIQRPLRVCQLLATHLTFLIPGLGYPRTFQVNLYPSWHQHRCSGSVIAMGFQAWRPEGIFEDDV